MGSQVDEKAEVEWTQEIRFAVVMYGGVSLAIYINGVAQELLRLVRATAAEPVGSDGKSRARIGDPDLKGSERVYRELGRMLAHGALPAAGPICAGPIRTRFVVDVLSGTSAGGINGVFLAKALVNDQDIGPLKDLWVMEGDIARLINDDRSFADLAPMPPGDAPRSLLAGRRMYKMLLDALRGMDERSGDRGALVDELDLFVTTTDVKGPVISLQLADKVVHERRYRRVFHRRYDGTAPSGAGEAGRNDFRAGANPMLAFASRCTSAFPAAFEPMTLKEAAEVLRYFPRAGEDRLDGSALAEAFEEPSLAGASASSRGGFDFETCAFADGGYLDNKPFSYAIDALANRRASLPVTRKLFYIEPAPEHPEREKVPVEAPNALENIRAALVGIPRYESIREDLQRLLARNRLVERVDRIMSGLEDDFTNSVPAPHRDTYGDEDLSGMVQQYGKGYGGYHRLKVAGLTDEIASAFSRAAGFDPDSDQFVAVRYLVRAWRDHHYVHYRRPGDDRVSFNRFLMDYDLGYRIRRLQFLRRYLDQLAADGAGELKDDNREALPALAVIVAAAKVRKEVDDIQARLVRVREVLQARGEANPLHPYVVRLDPNLAEVGPRAAAWRTVVSDEELRLLLEQGSDERRLRYARRLLGIEVPLPRSEATSAAFREDGEAKRLVEAFRQGAERLAALIGDAAKEASSACEGLWGRYGPSGADLAVRRALMERYRRFEEYDFVAYPILYATDAGDERDHVDVIRISPEDAVALGNKPDKLAGTALHHFGAFLDGRWRRNDILWGRLDGAERIIAALLPDPTDGARRDALIRTAQIAILREELGDSDRPAIVELLARMLAEHDEGDRERIARDALCQNGPDRDNTFLAVLREAAEDESLYEYYRSKNFRIDRTLDRTKMTRVAARATQVVGRMLENMATPRPAGRTQLAWLARLGRGFWAMVEVAVPESAARAVFKHLTAVFMLFSLLLALVGFTLGNQDLRNLGFAWATVVAVLALWTWLLENFLRGGTMLMRVLRLLLVALACAVLYFVAVGVDAKLHWNPVIFKKHLAELIGAGGAVVLAGALLSNLPPFLRGLWRGVVRLRGLSPLRRGRQLLGAAADKARAAKSWIESHLPWRRGKVSPPVQ